MSSANRRQQGPCGRVESGQPIVDSTAAAIATTGTHLLRIRRELVLHFRNGAASAVRIAERDQGDVELWLALRDRRVTRTRQPDVCWHSGEAQVGPRVRLLAAAVHC